ncbi:arylesterase [Pedobacter sp. MR2016-19]|uniref:arylesterase n=1 Tax=Pedobacter sp. MR2016-19 TaxID=2780089 RepID=UPI001873E495|nr:arylesterase [Pedobacter sp. MR2016-19]MBE5318106.1 arylesterase [Pedobacter sp. MR2016-19]
MLRKRLMGLFVLSLILLSCGNQQSKSNTDKTLDSADQKVSVAAAKKKNILFFGTSLTAGYGLDPTEAYPALIQNRIDSLKMPYNVINGGLSGETSAGGKGRIDWLLKQPVDIFVLELGANDGLRGLPVAQTIKNLQAIIDRVKAKYPEAKMVIAGMQVPPNMGAKYAADFKNIFPDLAKKNQMALIPFLLDKVGGGPKLNQADGIHPTAEGDKILAENVWVVLKGLL